MSGAAAGVGSCQPQFLTPLPVLSTNQVITREIDGKECEPYEEAIVEVPENYVGGVVELFAARKGEMVDMQPSLEVRAAGHDPWAAHARICRAAAPAPARCGTDRGVAEAAGRGCWRCASANRVAAPNPCSPFPGALAALPLNLHV